MIERIRRIARHVACRRATSIAALLAAAALGACASSPPVPVFERTDERTAVTVATMPKPLLYSGAKGELGQRLDLALGPVEINRMGTKTWYLWTAVLGGDVATGEPRLRLTSAGRALVDLAAAPSAFTLPVSAPPYEKPANWASERWFPITADELAGLQGHRDLHVEIVATGNEPWRFEPWEPVPDALDAYLRTLLQGRAGTR